MSESRIIQSLFAALLSAVIGGIIWAAVALLTGYEVSLLAWAIGGMAGYSVVFASKGHITLVHQAIAIIASLIGIVLGKYFHFGYWTADGIDGIFNSYIFSEFTSDFIEFFSLYDIIFVLLAVVTAWQIPEKHTIVDDPFIEHDEAN